MNFSKTKYLNNISKNEQVVKLYDETKQNLLNTLKGNDDLKIIYNSFRQLNNNIENYDLYLNKPEVKYYIDPIADAEMIENIIYSKREN